jgi:hypothetical protein
MVGRRQRAILETCEHLAEPMNELWQAHESTASRRDTFRLRMELSDLKPPSSGACSSPA